MRAQIVTMIARQNVTRKRLLARHGQAARDALSPQPLALRLRAINHPYALPWRPS